jgi:hypothetical protein
MHLNDQLIFELVRTEANFYLQFLKQLDSLSMKEQRSYRKYFRAALKNHTIVEEFNKYVDSIYPDITITQKDWIEARAIYDGKDSNVLDEKVLGIALSRLQSTKYREIQELEQELLSKRELEEKRVASEKIQEAISQIKRDIRKKRGFTLKTQIKNDDRITLNFASSKFDEKYVFDHFMKLTKEKANGEPALTKEEVEIFLGRVFTCFEQKSTDKIRARCLNSSILYFCRKFYDNHENGIFPYSKLKEFGRLIYNTFSNFKSKDDSPNSLIKQLERDYNKIMIPKDFIWD